MVVVAVAVVLAAVLAGAAAPPASAAAAPPPPSFSSSSWMKVEMYCQRYLCSCWPLLPTCREDADDESAGSISIGAYLSLRVVV